MSGTFPRIGPCRDPLRLWFLEWVDREGNHWRRYFADRAEALQALSVGRIVTNSRRRPVEPRPAARED